MKQGEERPPAGSQTTGVYSKKRSRGLCDKMTCRTEYLRARTGRFWHNDMRMSNGRGMSARQGYKG